MKKEERGFISNWLPQSLKYTLPSESRAAGAGSLSADALRGLVERERGFTRLGPGGKNERNTPTKAQEPGTWVAPYSVCRCPRNRMAPLRGYFHDLSADGRQQLLAVELRGRWIVQYTTGRGRDREIYNAPIRPLIHLGDVSLWMWLAHRVTLTLRARVCEKIALIAY
ncbi:hypothetical protein VTK73DRAFT_6674 [Phialemonium thermophilum]|uniref:Transposase n=1 Tax=Phialemonium thermophilum TaxID=223376 RepID=A0ABR3WIB0_9PEZI